MLRLFLAATLLVHSTSTWACWGPCSAETPEEKAEAASTEQLEKLNRLFNRNLNPPQPAAHTFVFFVEGAADHYVPQFLDNPDGKWGRADAYDMNQIKALAQECRSCNVVALHIQRGGSHWYTASHPWATYLRVYSRGENLLSKHVNVLNGADPRTLTRLLLASQAWFQDSQLHLIYRGHGFDLDYDPTEKGEKNGAPFDLNFPESPYGIQVFAQSISDAQLKGLGTISLAACEMKKPRVLELLTPLAPSVIATEQLVDETLSKGFNYGFLVDVRDSDRTEEVAKRIQMSLFPESIPIHSE